MSSPPSPTHLVTCGFSHVTAPLDLRERYALPKDGVREALHALMEHEGVHGTVIVSTCNRLECYLECESPRAVVPIVLDLLDGVEDEDLRSALYTKLDSTSGRHLFRVCAGLESLVLGENQIQGQVRDAYSLACRERTASPVLHRAFHEAFRTGKAVRANTDLGKGPKSVGGVALELMAERLAGLHDRTVLMVGVSPMNEIAAEKLARLGASVLVVNRTFERAKRFAGKHHARALPFERLPAVLHEVDAVISCTSSTEPLLTVEEFVPILESRSRELCLVDLAVPRDFVPLPEPHPRLYSLDLDDLHAHHQRTLRERVEASRASEAVVEERVAVFGRWLRLQKLAPRVQAASKEARRLFERDLEIAAKHHSPEEMKAIEAFGRIVLKHTLDATLRILKDTPPDIGGPDVVRASEEQRQPKPALCRAQRDGPRSAIERE